MKNWLFFFLLILSFNSAFGQDKRVIDSLKRVIKETPYDSIKAGALNEIGLQNILYQVSDGEKYLHQARKISFQINYSQGKLDALNGIGLLHYRKASYDSSIFYYKQCLPIAIATGDSVFWAKVTASIGLVQIQRGNYEDALKKILESQPIEEKHAPDRANASYIDLGNIYYYLDQKEKALEYAKIALQKGKETTNLRLIAEGNTMVGSFLSGLERFDEAKPYLFKSLKMHTQQGDKAKAITAMINISKVHESQKKYNETLAVLDSAYLLAFSINDKQQMLMVMTNQGIIYSLLENHQKAVKLFKDAYKIAINTGALYHQMELAGKLAIHNERIQNFKKATSYYKTQSDLKDIIFKKDTELAIAEMHTKYETERVLNEKLSEERKNAELQKDNIIKDLKLLEEKAANKNLMLWSGLSLGLVLLLGLIYYFNTRVKEAKYKRDEETARYRAVLEAEEKARAHIAKDLHDGLGQLLSTAKLNISGLEDEVNEEDKVLVQNSMNLIDEAVNEVRTISHNMMPAALMEYGLVSAIESLTNTINKSKALHVNFSCKGMDNRLEENKEIALYRVIQEILNNMIKYAQADQVIIALKRVNDKVSLSISDNGQGFDVNTIHYSKGIGWRNIFSRISMVNGEIDVVSDKAKGTNIRIELTI